MAHDFEKDATRVGYQYFTSRRFLPKLRKIYRVLDQVKNDEKYGGRTPEAPYLVPYGEKYLDRLGNPTEEGARAFYVKTEMGFCFFPLGAFGRLFGIEERTLKKHFRDFVCDFPDELGAQGVRLPSNGTKCVYVSHMMMDHISQLQEAREQLEKVPVMHRMAKIILS